MAASRAICDELDVCKFQKDMVTFVMLPPKVLWRFLQSHGYVPVV
jgi:hypothetical protein